MQEYASGGAGVAEGLVNDSLPFRAGLAANGARLPIGCVERGGDKLPEESPGIGKTCELERAIFGSGINLDLVGMFVAGREEGGTIGKRVLEKAFENSVKAIEAQNSAARDARAS